MKTSSLQDLRSAGHSSEESLLHHDCNDDSLDESVSSLSLNHSASHPALNLFTSRPRRRNNAQIILHHGSPRGRRGSRDKQVDRTPTRAQRHHTFSSAQPSLFGLGIPASGPGTNSNNSANANDSQPPPLGHIISELCIVCCLYVKYMARIMRKPCQRLKLGLTYAVCSVLAILLLLSAWLALDFYQDAVRVCTPPPDYVYDTSRPLVEYYIHGRGIGHYARSVAIVEQLNEAGIDVRMFLSRQAMWRALHEDSRPHIEIPGVTRGVTTAIAVASLTPSFDILSSMSHMLERIIGDCDVSAQSHRYPHLVVSDGDMPGMLRAKFGSIPSVGIAHGQLFTIAQKPSWISNNRKLSRGWDKQQRLNGRAGFFSEWQIATHFCFLESRVASGVVARAPLRPEVLQMAVARKQAHLGLEYPALPQLDKMSELLLVPSTVTTTVVNMTHNNKNTTAATKRGSNNATSVVTQQILVPPKNRRRVVICYYRDRNGAAITQALLNAGFDVLLFDTGYVKNMEKDPERYGAKWVIHDDEREKIRLLAIHGEEEVKNDDQRNKTNGKRRRLLQEEVDSEIFEDETGQIRRQLREEPLNKKPRLIRVMDRSLFAPLMNVADGVASSAGSQLMSECIFSEMPLLAFYLEHDDEQRLNVELSRHCQKPQVFGASFESFRKGITSNGNSNNLRGTNHTHSSNNSFAMKELDKFIRVVQASRVSEAFYNQFSGGNMTKPLYIPRPEDADDGPFRGLPHAAAIMLEIIKQVESNLPT
jgi:hypothetical protein